MITTDMIPVEALQPGDLYREVNGDWKSNIRVAGGQSTRENRVYLSYHPITHGVCEVSCYIEGELVERVSEV